MKYDCFIGIDPGKNGGIAIIDYTGLRTFKMPASIRMMVEILETEAKSHSDCLVLIERVGMYRTDPGKGGKVFNIAKMIENFTECRSALKMAGMNFKLVESRKWQGYLRLNNKTDSQTQRKNRFKDFAQSMFPNVKITLATSDATCLAIFAYKAAKFNMEIIDNLVGND